MTERKINVKMDETNERIVGEEEHDVMFSSRLTVRSCTVGVTKMPPPS